MGKKESILKLLIEFDGLTYNRIIELYNERFNPDTLPRTSGYKYLQRLRKKGLIIHESNIKGKHYIYKPTGKALNNSDDNLKPLLKELHSIMNKRMDFVENPTESEISTIRKIERVIK